MGELKYLGQAGSELHARTFAAWFRSCKRDGAVPDQPREPELYEMDGREYAVLSNARGLMACYRITTQGTLKRLRRVPKEILAAVEGET